MNENTMKADMLARAKFLAEVSPGDDVLSLYADELRQWAAALATPDTATPAADDGVSGDWLATPEAASDCDNPSGEQCTECRAVGMAHCSDPVNCGGMKPMRHHDSCQHAQETAPRGGGEAVKAVCDWVWNHAQHTLECGTHAAGAAFNCTCGLHAARDAVDEVIDDPVRPMCDFVQVPHEVDGFMWHWYDCRRCKRRVTWHDSDGSKPMRYCHPTVSDPRHAPPAAQASDTGRMPTAMRDWLEGMEVSVDVSTSDETAHHRYFGTVTIVQDNHDSKHGVILLVQDPEPNFKASDTGRGEAAASDREVKVPPGYAWQERDGEVIVWPPNLEDVIRIPVEAARGEAVPFGWWLTDCNGVGRFSRLARPSDLDAYLTTPGYGATPLFTHKPMQASERVRNMLVELQALEAGTANLCFIASNLRDEGQAARADAVKRANAFIDKQKAVIDALAGMQASEGADSAPCESCDGRGWLAHPHANDGGQSDMPCPDCRVPPPVVAKAEPTDAQCEAIYRAVQMSGLTRDVKTPERQRQIVRDAARATQEPSR